LNEEIAHMALDGKRVAVLIEDEYNLQEFTYPFYRLKEAGAEVKVVGTNRATRFSSHGYSVEADLPASDANAGDFDAVIIPGGYAPDKMRLDKDLVAFVADMDAAGKPVAAICHAGWMLVSARILKGRRATSFYSIRDDVEAAGASWSDEEVVIDGNLITSRTPGDLPAFCKAVIEALAKQPAAVS
jgi:protease I